MAKKKRKYNKRKQLPIPPKVKKGKKVLNKLSTIALFNMFVFFVIIVYGVLSKSFETLLVGFIMGFFTTIINFQLVVKK